jgi:hypothetical protein
MKSSWIDWYLVKHVNKFRINQMDICRCYVFVAGNKNMIYKELNKLCK